MVALIGAAAVALLAGGCAGTSTTVNVQGPTRTSPLETIFEAPSELSANPGATLDLLKKLGVDRVKMFIHWSDLAPEPSSHTRPHFNASSPAAYPAAGWAPFDAIVRAAVARGVGLDLTLLAPAPLWATGPGVPRNTASNDLGVWEPSAKEFGLFVRADTEPGRTAAGPCPRSSRDSRARSPRAVQPRRSGSCRARCGTCLAWLL
jgi:hypothetical protein